MEFQKISLGSEQYQEAASWLAQVEMDHPHFMGNNLFPQVDRAIDESQTVSIRINRQNQSDPAADALRFSAIDSMEFYSRTSYSEPNNLTHKIEQAKDSISPSKANLEAVGWTDLQDVELCSGRETWGCPPGGVCPRKVVHEDIQPWVIEKLSERLSVWGNAFQQQSHVSAESIREFSYCLSNLQPPFPGEEVSRDFEGGEDA